MSDNRQRRCRGCGESGHNIRSCITNLDEALIREYSYENVPTEFPTNGNKLKRLCQNYGLSIINVTDNIYISLGRQRRRNETNRLYLQQRQINIYRPSYLPPPTIPPPSSIRRSRFLTYLSLFYLPNHNREEDIFTSKPSLQIVVNPSKFIQNTDVMECPICYEECCNMLVTECNHSYCQPCISTFMNTVNKNILPCPLCRENIRNVYVFSETSSDLMLQI
jgi:hypothetical protein